MLAAVILAGGKGKRMNSNGVNKVAIPFHGKPLVRYAAELLIEFASPVVVVTGAYAESVHAALEGYDVTFAHQEEQLGTGHALKIGLEPLRTHSPEHIIVGYGDHMMYYTDESISKLVTGHIVSGAAITIVTTVLQDAGAYGRVIRNGDRVVGVVELKDATEEQKKIKEINTGLYCIDYDFVKEHIDLIEPSPVTNEFYLPELITLALNKKMCVSGVELPYKEVGIGINIEDELSESEKLYKLIRDHRNEI